MLEEPLSSFLKKSDSIIKEKAVGLASAYKLLWMLDILGCVIALSPRYRLVLLKSVHKVDPFGRVMEFKRQVNISIKQTVQEYLTYIDNYQPAVSKSKDASIYILAVDTLQFLKLLYDFKDEVDCLNRSCIHEKPDSAGPSAFDRFTMSIPGLDHNHAGTGAMTGEISKFGSSQSVNSSTSTSGGKAGDNKSKLMENSVTKSRSEGGRQGGHDDGSKDEDKDSEHSLANKNKQPNALLLSSLSSSSTSALMTLSATTVMQGLIIQVLNYMEGNLEKEANKIKSKKAVAALFLLNTLHYVLRSVKKYKFDMPSSWFDRYSLKVLQYRQQYRDATWETSLSFLNDLTLTADTQNGKYEIKRRFQGFNDAFDAIYSTQRMLTVSDAELRMQIRTDNFEIIVPKYKQFLKTYAHMDFTSHVTKYVKYDASVLETMLQKFFDEMA
jgi:hypothetical protein